MKTPKRSLAGIAAILAALSITLTGCSNGSAPPMSSEEKNEFKGGPMPASAGKIMAEKMAEARKKSSSAAHGPQ